MTMVIKALNKLFKPSWDNASPDVRLRAIAALDERKKQDQTTLLKLANHDNDESVRLAAVKKILDLGVLWSLVNSTENTENARLFSEQFATALRHPQTSANDIEKLINSGAEQDSQNKITLYAAAHYHDEAYRTQALEGLSQDTPVLLRVLEQTPFTKTRAHIVDLLNEATDLEKARNLIKGKDKAAERVLKQKLSTIRKQEARHLEQQQHRNDLLDELASLSEKADRLLNAASKPLPLAQTYWRQDHEQKSNLLARRWQDIERLENDESYLNDQQRYNQLIERVQLANKKWQAMQLAQAQYREAQSDIKALIETMDDLNQHPSYEQHRSTLFKVESAWQSSAQHLLPEAEVLLSFNEKLEQAGLIAAYLEQLNNTHTQDQAEFPWLVEKEAIAGLAEPLLIKANHYLAKQLEYAPANTQIKRQLLDCKREYQAIAKAKQRAFEQQCDALHKQLSGVARSLDHKDLSAAAGKYRRFNASLEYLLEPWNQLELLEQPELIKQLELEKQPELSAQLKLQAVANSGIAQVYQTKLLASLLHRSQTIYEDLYELGDWKSFATEPQCLALCEAMELLAEQRHQVEAPTQADEIRKLMNKWKALGASTATETYWSRFKGAMDTANEPCAVYFAELKQQREDNLTQLQQLVLAMQSLVQDVAQQDDVVCENVIKDIHQLEAQWKQYQYVERDKGRQQWTKFKAAKKHVYQQLEPYFAANLARKKTLVKRAESIQLQVTESGVSETTFDALKQLQSSWKSIGVARQKDDNQVWHEFKGHCDAIYASIKQERDELKEADQAIVAQYQSCIDDIKNLVKSSTQIGELDRDFGQLQTDYQSLPSLPETVPEPTWKKITQQYNAACKVVDQHRDTLQTARQADELQKFIEKAQLADELSRTNNEEQKQTLSEQWHSIELIDSALKSAAKLRFEQAQKNDKIDSTQLEKDKRLICIQAEIAADLPTPDEDKVLRTEFQLQQMQASGLGQSADTLSSKLDIEIAWYSLPALLEDLESALKQRLALSLNKL